MPHNRIGKMSSFREYHIYESVRNGHLNTYFNVQKIQGLIRQ